MNEIATRRASNPWKGVRGLHGSDSPGTAAEIERMVDEYGAGLLRLCCLYLKDFSLAEDALQETFLNAFRGLDAFQGRSSEKTWLTRIAINACKSHLRSPWRRLIDSSVPLSVPLDGLPEPAVPCEEADGDVLQAVARLPMKYREVILLHYDQQLSTREIANTLGVPQATVSTRLTRARARLKDLLKGGWSS
jgi:RNA polymerase sigma-70 factor (ECF subfamily)